MAVTEFEAELRARKFVQQANITCVPVDLSRYLTGLAGKVVLDDLHAAEAGYTMVTAKGPLITLNANDRAARRRFTTCHEIGHLVLELPSEHAFCPSWTYAKRPLNEVCCDVFAAELLLPYRLFTAAGNGLPLDFMTVDKLRVDFFASREAVASRLVATSKLACAYFLSEQGRIQHLVRSAPLRSANAWIARGTPLPSSSAAHILRTSGTGSGEAVYSGDVWFDGWKDVEVSEVSIWIPEYDQTLTLLTCNDQDEVDGLSAVRAEASEKTSDELLKPLDGVLPWPGKGKRKR